MGQKQNSKYQVKNATHYSHIIYIDLDLGLEVFGTFYLISEYYDCLYKRRFPNQNEFKEDFWISNYLETLKITFIQIVYCTTIG